MAAKFGIMSKFNEYKRQGLTDSAAMERALKTQVTDIAKIRKADTAARKAKAKQKPGWIEKLKMGATGYIKEKYHSKAGRAHLKKKKTGMGRGY